MDLLRHWRRGTFGAAAGALAVPGVILLAAVAVGLGGGGLGSLGAIGQALNGPQLPAVSPLSEQRPARDAGKLLARARTRSAAATASATRRTVGTRRSGGGHASRPARTQTPSAQVRPSTPVSARPTTPSHPVATAPAPHPTAPPTVVDEVGSTVKKVTNNVPLVGPPAGQVVDDVVNTVDQLLPPKK